VIQKVRIRFEKKGDLRAISHLDLMRAFERALRRTGLPLRMSEGHNPRPRMSLPVPLGVGVEGTDEVLEFDLSDWVPLREVADRLREQLPAGLALVSAELAPSLRPALAEEIEYRIAPRPGLETDGRLAPEALERLLAREDVPVRRIRKGREKVVNIRPFINHIRREGAEVVLRLKAGPAGSANPWEVLGALGYDQETCRSGFRVLRTQVRLAPD